MKTQRANWQRLNDNQLAAKLRKVRLDNLRAENRLAVLQLREVELQDEVTRRTEVYHD